MNIKTVSQATGLSAHTLRYYEKIGLIMHVPRDAKGHRDYSVQDVAWLEFLKRLKATGMALADMRTYAELRYRGDSTIDARLALLDRHYQKIIRHINMLNENRQKIEDKIKIYQSWKKSP